MSSEDFPDDVRSFITEHVASVAQLEILLLLRSDPARAWAPHDVSEELRVTAETTPETLRTLESQRIIAPSEATPGAYCYAPHSEALRDLIDRLAHLYEERRVAVITLIYSKPVDKVRTFADAFRLRKEP